MYILTYRVTAYMSVIRKTALLPLHVPASHLIWDPEIIQHRLKLVPGSQTGIHQIPVVETFQFVCNNERNSIL